MFAKSTGRKDKSLQSRGTHRSTSNSREHCAPAREKSKKWDYSVKRVLGRGTFGMVYLATLTSSEQEIAVKKVLQDDNYKNREHQIIKELNHCNIVRLYHSFFQREVDPEASDKPQIYLYLMMEYVPEDLHRVIRYFHQQESFPNILIKAYSFQIFRGLEYLQSHDICHRDIKPRNILLDLNTHSLKLCDFGSAKKLVKGESNLAYVCSRYYRAPELEMGNQHYGLKSDIWSVGAVIAEMVLGTPIFLSESSVDHMAIIISKMGTPTQEEMVALNPQLIDSYDMIPRLKARPWKNLLPRCDPLLRDLLSKVLVYDPDKRLSASQAMTHQYFKQLRGCKVNGKELKALYDTSQPKKDFPVHIDSHKKNGPPS